MDSWLRAALRERCCQFALHLYANCPADELLADIESLARDAWAFREEDDA